MKHVNRFKKVLLIFNILSILTVVASAQCFNSYTLSPTGTVCGSSATMTLSGSQPNVVYQLQVNGTNYGSPVVGGGGSVNLGTVTYAGSNGGGTFTVVASQNGSSCSATTIAGGSVYFRPAPSGNISASNGLVCPGNPVTLTANPDVAGNYYSYQWYLSGSAISGATSQNYTTNTAGSYSVLLSNSCGSVTLTSPAIRNGAQVGSLGAVSGPISLIAGSSGSSIYSVGATSNAAAYNFQISPAAAGTFTGTGGSSNTLNWNSNFYGTAIISVTAIGNCGPPSNTSFLNVSVDLPPSTSYSYIQETDVRIPGVSSAGSISALPIGQKSVMFTYMDQAGRPIQKVTQSATPGYNDMVQPMSYDPAGRQITSYLPFTVAGSNNGAYVATPIASQATYYNPSTPGAANIATSVNAVSQKVFDNSPLERTVEQGFPGSSWIQGGGHTVQTAYGANVSNEIGYWIINSGGNGASYSTMYGSGTLSTTSVSDENGNIVTQYTDFNGKMICKKVQSGPSTFLFTYYIYDDAGNLRYVIPPLPTLPAAVSLPSSFAETDAVFQSFFYGYHYDGRNRLIEKKVPGKGWEYFVYNKLDQVILSQTATQNSLGLWTFTKYDPLGRAVLTGNYTTASSRATLQSNADAFSTAKLFENFSNATTNFGYTDNSYPDNTVSSSKKVLSVSYYDNYSFLSNSSINPNTSVYTAPALDTVYKTPEGMLTGSLVNVLGASSLTYLLSINHYDTYGRTVKTISQSFKSGATAAGNYDVVQNNYSFTGLLNNTSRTHYLAGALQLTVNTFYKYDQAGRKIILQQQYNTGPLINLAEYDYNELGQLYKKSLNAPGQAAGTPSGTDITLSTADAITTGSKTVAASHSMTLSPGFAVASGAMFKASILQSYMQAITYTYNIRGWLTKINDPANFGTNTLFAEQIDYDQPNSAFSGTTPQYNGNISTSSWQTLAKPSSGMVQELKGYVYNYDNLNRLTASYFKAPSGNDKYNEALTYDELSNILTLNRNATASTYTNKLTYDYGTGSQRGNVLLDVTDNGGTDAYTSTFSYQANSRNETANTKTGVQQITYNELNLPSLITFSSGKTISFCYSGSGEELERVIKQGTTVNEDRSYIHGIEYTAAGIEYVHTEEGRARPGTNYVQEYNITDHLGNTRAVFGDESGNNTFSASNDIVQATDYYAFGRQIAYLDANPQFQYKYNGKEYSADLNEYNYGARYFNPVTARWNAIDNDADKNRRWSPYNYARNNSIRNVDADGNDGYDYNTAYANAVSLQISAAQNYSSYFVSDNELVYDYNHGFTSYDPTTKIELQAQYSQMANDAYHQATDWMKSYGSSSEGSGGVWGGGGGGSGGSFDWTGFSSTLLHLTPFGGVIDFANAAKSDNIGGAVLGLASTGAFFTGEGAVSNDARFAVAPLDLVSDQLSSSIGSSYVYRAITTENATTISAGEGLSAKAPNGPWSLDQHLTFGSSIQSISNDPWISTSVNYNIAKAFNSGNGIITIDLGKIPSDNIQMGWMNLGRTDPGYHYSIWQQEVSIFGNIPQEAIIDWTK